MPSLTRVSRRQHSEPLVREHVRVRTRDFLDGPNSVYEESSVVEGPARPSPTLPPDLHVLRVSEDEARRIRERLASSDEYELVADRAIPERHQHDYDWYEDDSRRSRRERRRPRRSQSKTTLVENMDNGKSKVAAENPDGDPRRRNLRSSEYIEAPRIVAQARAPTPPPADRRRSARHSLASRAEHDAMELRPTTPDDAVDRRGCPVVVRRRMASKSASQSRSRWNAPFGGRPPMSDSETIEMQERGQGRPTGEDYDWYDSHGQRVRVREI